MAYTFVVKDEAVKELTKAFLWYEEQQEGLGKLFRTKLNNKLDLICNNPLHYKTAYKKYHEALVDTFPFLIVYVINEKESLVIVMAVFHTSRNPKKKFRRV
jgi:plasmid stabilization system protein ParE